MTVKIVCDGSLTLPAATLRELDIPVVPPLVIAGGRELLSEVDISLDEFFTLQRTATTLPKTSQPAPGQFVAVFEEALRTHDEVLCICVSSGLSGTWNSAQQAAQTLPEGKVLVHDTLSISGGGGLQVIAAARAVQGGADRAGALAAAQATGRNTDFYFSVDDLTYLIKGGRIGRVAGAVGSFLNVKPIIAVDPADGKFQPHSRVRSFKAAMKKLADLAANRVGEGQPGRFMVLYGDMEAEAQELAETLRTRFDARWIHLSQVSPTLAAHTGSRALGLAVAKGDW